MKDKLFKYLEKSKEILVSAYKYVKENFKFIDKKVFIVLGIILALGIGFYIGYEKNSEMFFLNSLQSSLEKKDFKKISKLATLNNKKIKNKNDVKPFTNYFDSKQSISSFIKSLKKNQKWNDCVLLKKRKTLFIDKYYIDFKERKLSLTANFGGETIFLNDKNIGVVKDAGDIIKVDALIPGVYDIKAKLDNKKFNFEKVEKLIVMDENNNFEFRINGIKVSIDTPFQDAIVYINGEDSEIKAKDFKNIGPLPMDGSVKLSLKYNFPWGEIMSKEIEVRELPIINIPIDMLNDKLKSEVKTSLKDFYDSIFEALNKESKSVIRGASENLQNKIFNILKQKYFILKNTYKAKDISIDFNQSEFKYEKGKYKANVVVVVQYDVSKQILGVKLQEKEYEKNFFTNISYENGKWQVNDIDNFTLDLTN